MTDAPVGSLSIITLGVADLDRSIAFYSAFGWPQAASSVPGVITWFDLGTVWLGLYPTTDLAADSGLRPGAARPPGEFSGVTLAINLGSRDAVGAALDTARAAGAHVTLDVADTDYGVYHACFTDPDGHVWELAYNPGFPIVDGRTVIP
jgi:catechol 2,3-dioxygenase-like lactoylglutathione lyase family enzyme